MRFRGLKTVTAGLLVTGSVAILYIAVAALGFLSAQPPLRVPVFWPAAGFAVGAVLVLGWRSAGAGVWLGAFGASVLILWGWPITPEGLLGALGIAFGTLAQTALAGQLITRWSGFSGEALLRGLARWRAGEAGRPAWGRVGRYLGGAAVASLPAAAGGVLALAQTTSAAPADYAAAGSMWWLANWLGTALVLPVVAGLGVWLRSRPAAGEAVLLAIDSGLILSGLLFGLVWMLETQRIDQEFDGDAETALIDVQQGLQQSEYRIELVHAHLTAAPVLTQADIEQYWRSHLTGPHALSGALAIAWAVDDSQTGAVRVDYAEPAATAEFPFGVDLNADPAWHAALARARDSGAASVFLRPDPEGQASTYVIVWPVFGPNPPGGRTAESAAGPRGYVLGAYQLKALVAGVLLSSELAELNVHVFDSAAASRLVYRPAASQSEPAVHWAGRPAGRYYEVDLELADQRWLGVVTAAPLFETSRRTVMPWVALLAGLAVTAGAGLHLVQRQRGETALRRSQENLNRAQAMAHVGSWFIDLPTEQVTWTAELYRIFALPPETPVTPALFLERVWPEDRPVVEAAWAAALASGAADVEFRINVGGEARWVRERAEVLRGPAGVPHTALGTVQDITDQKSAAGDLRENQLLLQLVINSTPDWIFIKDRQHRYRLVNQAYGVSLGLTPDQVIGQDDLELGFTEASVKGDPARGDRGFWADDDEVLASGQMKVIPVEPAHLRGQALYLSTVKVPLKNAAGEAWGVLGFVHDVTERIRAEQALRDQEAQYRAAVETATDGFGLLDSAGRFLEVNDALVRLTGYSRPELLLRRLADLEAHGQPDELTAYLGRVSHAGGEVFEMLSRTQAGRVWHAEINAAHWPIADGRLFCFVRDVSRRKRSEALLQARVQLAQVALRGDLDGLLQLALDSAEALTDSQIGFFHFVDDDQIHLTLQAWSTNTLTHMCRMEGRGQHYAVDEAGVWVDCLRARRPVIHNDYAGLAHKRGLPPGHAPVVRELVVPILRDDRVVEHIF